MLVWQRPNLLLLDEPTNHLDLTTREALSMALNEFEGTVMLVSHDRALLREVCDEFWLVSGGELEPFDGDLDDYQRWLLEQASAAARAARACGGRAQRPCGGGGAAPPTRRPGVPLPPTRPRARRPQGRRRRAPAARRRCQAAEEGAQPRRQPPRHPVCRTRRARGGERRRDARRRAARRERPPAEDDRRADRAARGALARAQHATRRDRRIGRLTSLHARRSP